MANELIVEDYSPQWAMHFAALSKVYRSHLGKLIADIQHVGSTAVVGLAAKPIIDIDLIIDDRNKLNDVIDKLATLGYEHLGDLGIIDRDAFRRASSLTPIDGSGREWPLHNLYVCPVDSISLRNHLVLRDYLIAHPAKAREYGALKKSLVAANAYDIDLYIKNKTPFIVEILAIMGFAEDSLDDIRKANGAI